MNSIKNHVLLLKPLIFFFIWTFGGGCFWSACDDESPDGLMPMSGSESMISGTQAGEFPSGIMNGGSSAGSLNGGTQTSGEMSSGMMAGQGSTLCENDVDCTGTGLEYCFEGRCVPERPCDVNQTPSCPTGYLCIGGLCYEGGVGGTMGGDQPPPITDAILAFEPNRLRFTFSNAGDRSQGVAQLVNLGDEPLMLTRITVEGSATFTLLSELNLPLRLSPQEQLAIEIEYLANDPNGDQASLVAESDTGVSARLELYSETKGAGTGPCLEVSPAQIFFGSVPRRQSATREVTLTSCGNRAVTLSRIARGTSIFGTLPQTFSFIPPTLPLQLDPGQSTNFMVSYSPQRAGLEGGFIEVISDDVQSPSQRVDMSAAAEPPPLTEVALHVRLAWNTDLTDVDLHLLGPQGQLWTCEGDCYFSNGSPNWGDQASSLDDPFLDLDDVDGYGPENINLEAPQPGIYKVLVHYWSAHSGDDPEAEISVLNFGQEVATFGPRQLNQVDDVWEVAEIEFPGLIIRPIDQLTTPSRGPLCGGF